MDCPPWDQDRDEHEAPACFKDVRDALEAACRASIKAIPKRADIAQMHRDAFRRIVPLDYYAGGFRQDDPVRHCLAVNVGVAGANGLPPVDGFPFEHVLSAMTDLCNFVDVQLTRLELRWLSISASDRAQELARIVGVAIGRYIAIHPFRNGNGRTSRMLWAVLLARVGLPRTFSIVRRPGPPYGDVMRASMLGDYGPAIKVVLDALAKGPAPALGLPTALGIAPDGQGT